MAGKWWEQYLRKYEPTMPEEFQQDLDYIFNQVKNDSDDEY